MSWDLLGYSVAGLVALALVARWLRLDESRIGSPAKAREMAETRLAGFVAHGAVVGTDGHAALVVGNGALALLRRKGTKVAIRRLLPPLTLAQDIEGVRIESGERALGSVLLFGITTDEVRALEASIPFH